METKLDIGQTNSNPVRRFQPGDVPQGEYSVKPFPQSELLAYDISQPYQHETFEGIFKRGTVCLYVNTKNLSNGFPRHTYSVTFWNGDYHLVLHTYSRLGAAWRRFCERRDFPIGVYQIPLRGRQTNPIPSVESEWLHAVCPAFECPRQGPFGGTLLAYGPAPFHRRHALATGLWRNEPLIFRDKKMGGVTYSVAYWNGMNSYGVMTFQSLSKAWDFFTQESSWALGRFDGNYE